MEVRLSRAEYWLLETVVTTPLQVYSLAVPNLAEELNKPTHGLTPPRLADVLAGLFDRGWITASQATEADGPCRRMAADEIARELAEAAKPADDVRWTWTYQLTAAGGAVWESFAAPNWGRFIDVGYLWDERVGEFCAASEEPLRRYLGYVHHFGYRVHPGSERWDILEPWQATYWKSLPYGHRLRFDFTFDESSARGGDVPSQAFTLPDWYNWR